MVDGRLLLKHALAAAAVAVLIAPSGGAEKIRIGTEGAYPPSNYMADDDKAGFSALPRFSPSGSSRAR